MLLAGLGVGIAFGLKDHPGLADGSFLPSVVACRCAGTFVWGAELETAARGWPAPGDLVEARGTSVALS